MVGVTLPFGWKNSPMYIKLLDWVPRPFFRSLLGVACSLYIDDHLNGELFSSEGFGCTHYHRELLRTVINRRRWKCT